MDLLTTEIQGRPLSPIVEELVSHCESRCSSSGVNADDEIPGVAEERGQCADNTAGSPEQRAQENEGARLSADNTEAVATAIREISSAAVEEFADNKLELLMTSAKALPSSRTASSDGLAQLHYGKDQLQISRLYASPADHCVPLSWPDQKNSTCCAGPHCSSTLHGFHPSLLASGK